MKHFTENGKLLLYYHKTGCTDITDVQTLAVSYSCNICSNVCDVYVCVSVMAQPLTVLRI